VVTATDVQQVKDSYPPGTTVEFISFGVPDESSQLSAGDVGHVTFVDATGTVHVHWENGSTIGMLTLPEPFGHDPDFKPDNFRIKTD
jgi:hypothetical protein